MVESIGPNRKEKKSLGDLSYVRKGDIVHSWGQPNQNTALRFSFTATHSRTNDFPLIR